jgi:ribose 5-phosphate isomerase B
MNNIIAIGSDHVGYKYKEILKSYLKEKKLILKDFGCYSEERIDYPIISAKVANSIVSKECEKGILICGTGVGMGITANKLDGIRAVICSEPYSAKLSREHNDTNILAIGSRVIGIEMAKMIVDIWMCTKFDGGRHKKRISLITSIEKSQNKK